MDEQFWINDPYILLKNYYVIIPSNNMTRIEQLNTISRFLFYFLILCLLFNNSVEFILIILIAIILIIIFYSIYKTDESGIKKDIISNSSDDFEKFTNDDSITNNYSMNYPLINLYDKHKNNVFKTKNNKNIILESGYIDSNGNYKIGKDYSDVDIKDYINDKNIKNKKKKVSWEKNVLFNQNNCRKPTLENPFANIVFSDYLDAGNIPEPCNIDDKNIINEMQNLYNSSIYRNVDDVWERENSQRMFYSVPIRTIPNDQTDFANWLYKTPPTCHENTQNCNYYESPKMVSQRI